MHCSNCFLLARSQVPIIPLRLALENMQDDTDSAHDRDDQDAVAYSNDCSVN